MNLFCLTIGKEMTPFDYDIEKFMKDHGFEPDYRHGSYGMYISPLRNEKTASFKVDYNRNLWYDFGTGEGGGVPELCMRLDGCNLSEAFLKLSRDPYLEKQHHLRVKNDSSVKIVSSSLLKSPSLLEYLEERNVSVSVARGLCRELMISCNNKQHRVIGFKNDLGGWELRNRYMKISTSPKTITTLSVCKNISECHLFEGFMDFLTMVTINGNELPENSLILNSVNNISKALHRLKNYSKIFCYLDNDEAGRKTVRNVEESNPLSNVIDCSIYYKDYKDLNDCLTGKKMVVSNETQLNNNVLQAKIRLL